MSSKFNSVRKLRNRIFHHEAITWNLEAIQEYKYEILESLNWRNKDLLIWIENLNHVEKVIEENKKNIKSSDFALDH